MSPDRWRLIERLYHGAVELDPEARGAFLAAESGGNQDLVNEVRSLVERHVDSRLDRPVWEKNPAGANFVPPARLGPYEIEAPLGAGGMGEVFRARDTRLNRTVAIKISRERFIGRLKGEARTAATLNHPNVVQIYEFASYDSADFIVMEYVPGKTLAELLQAAPLSVDQALGYANQIASALAAAHCAGIVNRDIKPANILVSDAGAIKMLDFGLAKI